MKYNICYNKRDFDAAIEFVNENNPHCKWDVENLMGFIKQGAKRNVGYITSGIDDWMRFHSTGGITIGYSHEGSTKKGYPIIDVDITVTPAFNGSNYIYEKVRE